MRERAWKKKKNVKKLIGPDEQRNLKEMSPRAIAAFSVRCAQRIQPYLLATQTEQSLLQLYGDPVQLGKEFCAGRIDQFEKLWSTFYLVKRFDRGARIRTYFGQIYHAYATAAVRDTAFVACSLNYQSAKETPVTISYPDIKRGFYHSTVLSYPYQDVGIEKAVEIVVGVTESIYSYADMVSQNYLPENRYWFHENPSDDERLSLIKEHEENEEPTEFLKREIRRDYETLLNNRESLLDENDPLGTPIDFDRTDLFGPLWLGKEPLWFKNSTIE